MSDSLQSHGPQNARLPCPSPSPRVYSNSCPLSWWCHPTISSSVVPFSSCLQSFPASGSFPMSQLFTSGSQSIGASASALVLPMNIQGWFALGLTGLLSFAKEVMKNPPPPILNESHSFCFFQSGYDCLRILIVLKAQLNPVAFGQCLSSNSYW